MKFKFFTALILSISPLQLSALILQINSIIVSASNPGTLHQYKNMEIAKNLTFDINEEKSFKQEVIEHLNKEGTIKNWPFSNTIFNPINLKIYQDKKCQTYNFDTLSDAQTIIDFNLENISKITLSVSIDIKNL